MSVGAALFVYRHSPVSVFTFFQASHQPNGWPLEWHFVYCLLFCYKKVRREYRKFFRANAGKKIYDFTVQRIVSQTWKLRWNLKWFVLFFNQTFARMLFNLHFLMSDCPDAKILPGPEEQHAPHVAHRQELARQALPLPGRSPQRAAENLPSLEGWSQKTRAPLLVSVPFTIAFFCHFMIYSVSMNTVWFISDVV